MRLLKRQRPNTIQILWIVKNQEKANNNPSYHCAAMKQFELKQSWKALRALNTHLALPVYPVFEDEKSKASDEISVKRKIALKKTDSTNIIAANFVWEQLMSDIDHAIIMSGI